MFLEGRPHVFCFLGIPKRTPSEPKRQITRHYYTENLTTVLETLKLFGDLGF